MPSRTDEVKSRLPDDLHRELVWARTWLTETALPFWSEAGFDRDENLFAERLDFSGKPIDVPRRLMVQCRQIYVFSHATLLGWFDGRDLVARALRTVLTDFATGDAKAPFAFSLNQRRQIVGRSVETYSYAFLLFALAWARRLLGSVVEAHLVANLITFLKTDLRHPTGMGFIDGVPRGDEFSRQNPQMHLLEALLEIDDVFTETEARSLCDELYRLFDQSLFAKDHLALLELHDHQWNCPDLQGAIFEPGHHFEWIWLLDRYGALSGTPVDHLISKLEARAFGEGIGRHGAVRETVEIISGVQAESRRCWATCEGLKAAASNFKNGRDPERACGDAANFLKTLRTCFLSGPFPGGWIDRIDAADQPLVDYVPASSLYHIFLAIAEADAVFMKR